MKGLRAHPSAAAVGIGWLLVSIGAGLGGAVAQGAEENDAVVIYQWTDSRGVYRYTPDLGRIPDNARDSVVTIQTGEGPPSRTPIYFDPDPRSKVVEVPVPAPAAGTAGGAPSQDQTDYEGRIRELEARIAEYEEAIKVLIDTPGTATNGDVAPELREIADRLPRLQAELDSLQRGRARAGTP